MGGSMISLEVSKEKCPTFPFIPDKELNRSNIVMDVHEYFDSGSKVILVKGGELSGKTNLLFKLYRDMHKSCIAVSHLGNYINKDTKIREIIIDLYDQVCVIMYGNKKNLERYEFEYVSRELDKELRSIKVGICVIIDDFDDLMNCLNFEDFLRSYIFSSKKIKVILSTNINFDDKNLSFLEDFKIVTIPRISMPEAYEFLSDIDGIQNNDINAIYDKTKGVMGCVYEYRRLRSRGISHDESIVKMDKFDNILSVDWDYNFREEDTEILSLLAFYRKDIHAREIEDDYSMEILKALTIRYTFLEYKEDNTIRFISGRHKEFVKMKLSHMKEHAEDKIIGLMKKWDFSKQIESELPQYLIERNKINDLLHILSFESIRSYIIKNREIETVKILLKQILITLRNTEDWSNFIIYSYLYAFLAAANVVHPSKNEIDALLSVGKFDEVFAMSRKCPFDEDKLFIYARILNKCGDDLIWQSNIKSEISYLSRKINKYTSVDKGITIASLILDVCPEEAAHIIKIVFSSTDKTKYMEAARTWISAQFESQVLDRYGISLDIQKMENFLMQKSEKLTEIDGPAIKQKLNSLSNTSEVLLSGITWINSRKDNKYILEIADLLVNKLFEDVSYQPSMRAIRQLSEIIKKVDENCDQYISNLESIVESLSDGNLEDKYRFYINIAIYKLKNGFYFDVARLNEEINSIKMIDIKLYCLLYFYVEIKKYFIEIDTKWLEKEVDNNIKSLLFFSAEQDNITKRIFGLLSKIDYDKALEYCMELNTDERRDYIFQYLCIEKSKMITSKEDIDKIATTLSFINNKKKRGIAYLRVISQMSKDKIIERIGYANILIKGIDLIEDPHEKALAYAFSVKCCKHSEKSMQSMYDKMQNSVNNISPEWRKIDTLQECLNIIGDVSVDLCDKIIDVIRSIKSGEKYNEDYLIQARIEYIRLLGSFLQSGYCVEDEKFVNILFEFVIGDWNNPVTTLQLYSELLQNLYLSEKIDLYNKYAQKLIEYANDIEENHYYEKMLKIFCPSLVYYDISFILDQKNKIDRYEYNDILVNCINYIISKIPTMIKLDWDGSRMECQIVPHELEIIEKLICHMDYDYSIKTSVDQILEWLVSSNYKSDREELRPRHIIPRNIGKFCNNVLIHIDNVLPDKDNIRHDGYKVCVMAAIERLRCASLGKKMDRETADKIQNMVKNISNKADFVFVCVEVSSHLAICRSELSNHLMTLAEYEVNNIPTFLDKTSRLIHLASVKNKMKYTEIATTFLQEALSTIQKCTWSNRREAMIRSIISIGHSISPEIGDALSSRIENPMIKREQEIRQKTKMYIKSSNKTEEIKRFMPIDKKIAIMQVNNTLLKDIYHGKIRDAKMLSGYIIENLDMHTNDLFRSIYIMTNSYIRTTKSSSYLINSLRRLVNENDNISLTSKVLEGEIRFDLPVAVGDTNKDIISFGVGSNEREKFLEYIKKWIDKQESGSIFVLDPYFSPEEIKIFDEIKHPLRITIITSPKDKSMDINQLVDNYRNNSSGIMHADIKLYLVYTKFSYYTPIHDRAFTPADASGDGLKLGGSVNGYGSKILNIQKIQESEVAQFNNDNIVGLVFLRNMKEFKGEKLLVGEYHILDR